MAIKERIIDYIGEKYGALQGIKARVLYEKTIGRLKHEQVEDGAGGYFISKGKHSGEIYVITRFEKRVYGMAAVILKVLVASLGSEKEGCRLMVCFGLKPQLMVGEHFYDQDNNIWERYYIQDSEVEKLVNVANGKDTVVALPINQIGIYASIKNKLSEERLHRKKN